MDATLDNVRDLTPRISGLAATIERDRALPADLLADLKAAGVFRMYVPKSHGGDELPPLDVVRVIEEISRADASVGWLATIGANSPALFAFLPPETYDKIYAEGPDVIQAGSLIPRGRAVPQDGGYRFSGQWPFASGCRHADYIGVASIVEPRSDAEPSNEAPRIRFGVVPAAEVEILDTWHVSGLKATGSHDVQVSDLFVSEEWTGSFAEPAPVVRHPLDAVRPLGRLGLELAAVAVGTAQGALDDLIEIGRIKKPLGGLMRRLAEDPSFQRQLGELDLELRTRGSCSTPSRAPTTNASLPTENLDSVSFLNAARSSLESVNWQQRSSTAATTSRELQDSSKAARCNGDCEMFTPSFSTSCSPWTHSLPQGHSYSGRKSRACSSDELRTWPTRPRPAGTQNARSGAFTRMSRSVSGRRELG